MDPDPRPDPPTGRGTSAPLLIQGARIYPTPDSAAVEDGSVLVEGGRIVAVGPDVPHPVGAHVIAARGRTLTAGFWNAHVHFTEPKWRRASRERPDVLNPHLREMFTGRGFTTVVDTGSDPRSTLPLRDRIERGELDGPRIYTAGPGLYPPHGIPYYLRDSIPLWVRPRIPQPSLPAAARRVVQRSLDWGCDLVKLFTGSYVARGTVRTMPDAVARAAVEAAHARGKIVYSHPSNLEGTRVALRAGVDVLAHPPDSTEGVDSSLLRTAVDCGIGMTPTLKMFADTVSSHPRYLDPIYAIVREFHRLGGELLFGTDVGFMPEYAIEDELMALTRAGVDGRGILKMLTTAPARRMGVAGDVGSITVGERADLVLLDRDPLEDAASFAKVALTVRGGRVLHTQD